MIRKFKEKDAKECSKIMLECVDTSTNLNNEDKKFMINKSQPQNIIDKSKKGEFYVNEVKGKIIGTGYLDGNEIRTMFVKPSFQGKGCGKEMLLFLIDRAKSKGLKKVWLKSSPIAEKFYRKYGFKKIKIRNDHGFKTIEMKKKIK